MARVDLQATGGADLQRVAARLKEVGDKGLQREAARGIQRATKPMREAAQAAAERELPHRGGLNERVAVAKFSTRTRSAGRNPGVRVVVANGMDLPALDRGRIRHPVFGKWRRNTPTQVIKPRVISDGFESKVPQAREEIDKALSDVTRKLEAR